ncbi:hypothetical protein BDU57DRAFT_527123 [Ampelomyces quisqualis]|uniref:Uncharacterized protein n=1 Tax=Ampelomyces quisqualis TaxID=50730 RepID=A0A6A5QTA6_AMPQU|nr:hypothetical protein BDU57DRAFT_527123 [Ampelomyces quisqualis]
MRMTRYGASTVPRNLFLIHVLGGLAACNTKHSCPSSLAAPRVALRSYLPRALRGYLNSYYYRASIGSNIEKYIIPKATNTSTLLIVTNSKKYYVNIAYYTKSKRLKAI